MKVYYELSKFQNKFRSQYYVQTNIQRTMDGGFKFDYGMMMMADRVWLQNNEGEISYMKHRFGLLVEKVDLEEFVWIKLQCLPFK